MFSAESKASSQASVLIKLDFINICKKKMSKQLHHFFSPCGLKMQKQ